MMSTRPGMPYGFRLHPAGRTLVLLMIALALAAVISLVWIGAAHPQGGALGLSETPQFGGSAAIRRLAAWLAMAACGLVVAIGLLLLVLDFRTGRLAGHRPGKHLGRP